MRKILIAFDGFHFSEGAFEFARSLNDKDPILLTGVFLPQASYANLWAYADGSGAPMFVPVLEDDETAKVEANIEKFESLCVRHHIEFRTHKDYFDLALPELKKESRFADLMIIGGEKFYENQGAGEPNTYLKEALHEMECPVLIVPEKFDFPSVNIIAYDGTEASVFAIKQFVYLLPELTQNPTLLTFAHQEQGKAIPFEAHIEELAARHFSDLTVSKIDLDARKHFATWLSEKKSSIVVAGSFGRSSFSRLFSRSFLTEVIRQHLIPVFIAHR
jgi:nucleotide-binding universal stress UspA family protein